MRTVRDLVYELDLIEKEYHAVIDPLYQSFDAIYEADVANCSTTSEKWELYKSTPRKLLNEGWYNGDRDYRIKAVVKHYDTMQQEIVEEFEFFLPEMIYADETLDDHDHYISKDRLIEWLEVDVYENLVKSYSRKLHNHVHISIPEEVIDKWKLALIKNQVGSIHIQVYY